MTPLLAPRLLTDRGFERIYRRHVRDVYRYTLAMLHNPADAEDVTQTTFLNAYRAYRRGERPREPQNWLIAIAHNVCRQRFRRSERRVQEVMYDDNVAETVVEAEDETPTVQDIQRALGHLAFNQRSALVMRELEGRSYAEIAEILGLSVGAVETLIFRARRTLREQLEGTLTCREAERAISRQLDNRLPHEERASLRAHLRECKECATLARKLRAQSAAIKAFGLVPLPTSLSSFGSLLGQGAAAGGATAAGGVALKIAAVTAAGTVAGGISYQAVTPLPWQSSKAEAKEARPAPQAAAAAAGAAPTASLASNQAGVQSKGTPSELSVGEPGKEGSKSKKQIPAGGSGKAHGAASKHPLADGSASTSQSTPKNEVASEKGDGSAWKAPGQTKAKSKSKSKGSDQFTPKMKTSNGAQPHHPSSSGPPGHAPSGDKATPRGNGPPHTPPGHTKEKGRDKVRDAEKNAKKPQAPLVDKGLLDLEQLDDSPEHASAAEGPALQPPATPAEPPPPGQEKDKDKEKDTGADKEKEKGKGKGK
jgi:RNA polymerase sigma factor (sigma-70 family)